METLNELLGELAMHGEEASILAGGQSLVPLMNLRMARPELLLDINQLTELSGIRIEDDRLVIGALTRHVGYEHGAVVETIEGASESGRLKPLQDAFHDCAALQCGFCTPGMLLTAAAFLARDPSPDRDTIREAISGNLCRCTGYQAIVDAIETVATSERNDD